MPPSKRAWSLPWGPGCALGDGILTEEVQIYTTYIHNIIYTLNIYTLLIYIYIYIYMYMYIYMYIHYILYYHWIYPDIHDLLVLKISLVNVISWIPPEYEGFPKWGYPKSSILDGWFSSTGASILSGASILGNPHMVIIYFVTHGKMIHGLCGIIPGWIGWSIKRGKAFLESAADPANQCSSSWISTRNL